MDIVGYTFQAETLCGPCVLRALPTGPGQAFDGWQDMTGTMSPEDNLSEIAHAFGIDRMDEYTFDSDDFPKVIFSTQIENVEHCDHCGGEL